MPIMPTPHKWADVIKAWADGKPIQCIEEDIATKRR